MLWRSVNYKSFGDEQRETAPLFKRKDYNYNQAASFEENKIIPYSGLYATALNEMQINILEEIIIIKINTIKILY